MTLKQIITIALGLFLLYLLFTVGFPFLIALIIVMSLEPFVQLLMRKTNMSRMVAATISSSLFTLVSLGLMYWISAKVFGQIIALFRNTPSYINGAYHYFTTMSHSSNSFTNALSPEVLDQLNSHLASSYSTALSSLQGTISKLPDTLLKFVSIIPNALIVYIVFTVAVYLFSYSLPTMKANFLSLFAEDNRSRVDTVLVNLRNSIFGFLRAQVLLSVITYILTVIGLLIIDVKFALAIGLLVIAVDILPILGTGSVFVPWAIYEWLVNGDLKLGIGLVIIFLVITIVRRVIEPKILGQAVGIGPLSTLISMFIGFQLIGAIGLIFGPVVVIIYQAMFKEGLIKINIKLDA
jgi:sporulation integral membrane protein YtvI